MNGKHVLFDFLYCFGHQRHRHLTWGLLTRFEKYFHKELHDLVRAIRIGALREVQHEKLEPVPVVHRHQRPLDFYKGASN